MRRRGGFIPLVIRPGKSPALPEDSSSLTIPGEDSGVEFIFSRLRLCRRWLAPGLVGLLLGLCAVQAETFLPPTANRALLHRGHEEEFFVGTAGKPWMSGSFGCGRTDGWQMHEGLDIRCLQRDRRNEPLDPVMATADGVVVYL